jgi:hypothetical protein
MLLGKLCRFLVIKELAVVDSLRSMEFDSMCSNEMLSSTIKLLPELRENFSRLISIDTIILLLMQSDEQWWQ